MKEKELLNSIKRSIDETPIDVLQNIKDAPREKMLRHDDITMQKTKGNVFKKLMPYASIAAAFLLVFFGWQYQTKSPDSHIYVDVNPSIEIITNRLDKVIDIKAENSDGKLLTEDLNYKDKTVDQVAEEVLDRMINKKYLDKDNKYLLISVYNNNKDKAETQKLELDKKIHEHLKEKEFEPIVLSQKLENTSTIESFAKDYGISVNKMTFIRNLVVLNPELEAEELVDLSIKKLVELSQEVSLDLNKIIDSTDFDKIKDSKIEDDPVESVDKKDEGDKKAPEKPGSKGDIKPAEKPIRSRITLEEAKEIAMVRTGGGTITELEFDDGEYEIEINHNGKEYKIEIDVYTGKIIEFEVDDDEDDKGEEDDEDDEDDDDDEDDEDDEDDDDDDEQVNQEAKVISFDAARKIALSLANGKITDFDFKDDDLEFEVEIELDELEYEITIDAVTGEVIEVEIDE